MRAHVSDEKPHLLGRQCDDPQIDELEGDARMRRLQHAFEVAREGHVRAVAETGGGRAPEGEDAHGARLLLAADRLIGQTRVRRLQHRGAVGAAAGNQDGQVDLLVLEPRRPRRIRVAEVAEAKARFGDSEQHHGEDNRAEDEEDVDAPTGGPSRTVRHCRWSKPS